MESVGYNPCTNHLLTSWDILVVKRPPTFVCISIGILTGCSQWLCWKWLRDSLKQCLKKWPTNSPHVFSLRNMGFTRLYSIRIYHHGKSTNPPSNVPFPPEIAGRSMIRACPENPLVSLDKPGFIKPLFRFWVYVAGGVYFDQVSMRRCVASSPPWSCFLELNPKSENQPAKIGIASIGLVYFYVQLP